MNNLILRLGFILLFFAVFLLFNIHKEMVAIHQILQRAEHHSVSTTTSGWQRVTPTGLGRR